MIKVKRTANEALAEFKKWVNKSNSAAPKNPWCFKLNIADCALGYTYFVGYPKTMWSVSAFVSVAKAAKTYRPANGTGKLGDAVFFDWTGNKSADADHIGFFIKEDKNYVWNISANSTGHLVRLKKTSKRFVSGYGTVVKFAEEKPVVVTPKPPVVVVEPPVVPPVVVPPVVVEPPIVIPPTAKPKHKFDIVKKGDSYWAIARRTLAVSNTPKNYARIAVKSKLIQKWNKNKALHAGDKVRVK